METDLEIEIRHLLLDCKTAGIEVELDGDNLLVKGSPERADLYENLKRNKKWIINAMTYLPDAVETYYMSRLEKGRSFIFECVSNLKILPKDNPNRIKEEDKLIRYMYIWSMVDDELRRIYPEFRGCSMVNTGGCDSISQSFKCNFCAENTDDK
tara:strand:- start:54 stop:515 length:462 start_codon:yes stop_codon:yes gene_type:complete